MRPRETHPRRPAGRRLAAAVLLVAATAAPAAPSTAPASKLANAPDRSELRALALALGDEPRVAGTPGARRAADRIADVMARLGLEVRVHEYDVWLPHARSVAVETGSRPGRNLAVGEGPLAGDGSDHVAHYPLAAGYSAAGRVAAPLVYAHYGRPADFLRLAQAGVDPRGRVVLIRYGGIFRGDKVRNAESAGAAAVILYSDPDDDGYARGAVYPDGPFRPPAGVQRGSIKIGAPGDAASPGRPALTTASRRPPVEGLPGIPVVALGYAAAQELLQEVRGPAAPADWQGGLPLQYRFGGAGAPVRVAVELEPNPWRRIRNVVGTLRGAVHPDEWVILGAHYDSWTHGAVDNVSGTVAMLEAARVLSAEAAVGGRPARSILFAAWDAEEWGLVGSTEWVEEHAAHLRRSAVAYLNLDAVAGGPYFSALASPSLRPLLRQATDAVFDPVLPDTSVGVAWRQRGHEHRIALPGGGSDYAPFISLAGVPVAGFGFSAAAGIYHSAYDTLDFMERFGDPGYRQHRAVAGLAAWTSWRLAADGVPALDYRPLAADLADGMDSIRRWLEREGAALPGFAEAWASTGRVVTAAGRLQNRLHRDARGWTRAQRVRLNDQLRHAHRQLTAVESTAGWNRSVLVAPDPRDTYRALLLPGVVEPLRRGDRARTVTALYDLARRLDALAGELEVAERMLHGTRRAAAAGGH